MLRRVAWWGTLMQDAVAYRSSSRCDQSAQEYLTSNPHYVRDTKQGKSYWHVHKAGVENNLHASVSVPCCPPA